MRRWRLVWRDGRRAREGVRRRLSLTRWHRILSCREGGGVVLGASTLANGVGYYEAMQADKKKAEEEAAAKAAEEDEGLPVSGAAAPEEEKKSSGIGR